MGGPFQAGAWESPAGGIAPCGRAVMGRSVGIPGWRNCSLGAGRYGPERGNPWLEKLLPEGGLLLGSVTGNPRVQKVGPGPEPVETRTLGWRVRVYPLGPSVQFTTRGFLRPAGLLAMAL
jgi:hypothetical protein